MTGPHLHFRADLISGLVSSALILEILNAKLPCAASRNKLLDSTTHRSAHAGQAMPLCDRLAGVERPLERGLAGGVAAHDTAENHFHAGRPGLLFAASLRRSNPATATADKNGRLWMIRIAPNKSVPKSR
jgi:hypothetical protein